jgi:hypothetical protein
MGKSAFAVLLCLPCAVHAQRLVVEYEGIVSSVDRASLADPPTHSIGDFISGSFIIDAALAPRDMLADDPQIGRYYGGSPGTDFILGPAQAAGRGAADFVLVYDNWDPPSTGAPQEDGIIINDSSIGTDGDFNLLLGLQRPNTFGQIFFDDALAQSFSVEPSTGTKMWGYIERGFGEFWSVVDFALTRFSVTPRVCRP